MSKENPTHQELLRHSMELDEIMGGKRADANPKFKNDTDKAVPIVKSLINPPLVDNANEPVSNNKNNVAVAERRNKEKAAIKGKAAPTAPAAALPAATTAPVTPAAPVAPATPAVWEPGK